MGKLSLKLSHVMPYAWFYKPKEIGTPAIDHRVSQSDCNPPVHKIERSRKRRPPRTTCTSPINHKAIAIRFPVLTPKRKVSRNHDVRSNVPYLQAWTTGHNLSPCSHDSNLPSDTPDLASLSHHRGVTMDSRTDEKYLCDNSSARAGWKNGFRLDVRELERRLKALASEDRRQYYMSPIFSCTLPTPIPDDASNSLRNLDWPLAADYTGDVSGEVGFRMSQELICEDSTLYDDDGSSCSSSSFQPSSFTSGIGFERQSSSAWDLNDLYYLENEGNDLVTPIEDSDTSVLRASSRSQLNQQKERKGHRSIFNREAVPSASPSLVDGHLEIPCGIEEMFCDHSRESEVSGSLEHDEDNTCNSSDVKSTCLSIKRWNSLRTPDTGVDMERTSSKRTTLTDDREKPRDPFFQKASNSSQVFDSFAFMRCSYNPHQDFKDSMLEMILEKELHSSDDLVELMQCYLRLNSQKHHDTIVKVFCEVWSELFQ